MGGGVLVRDDPVWTVPAHALRDSAAIDREKLLSFVSLSAIFD
jgi:hypothetical protein